MNSLQPRQTSTLAIISLVAGVLGWDGTAVLRQHRPRDRHRPHGAQGNPPRRRPAGRRWPGDRGLVLGYLSIAWRCSSPWLIFLFFGGLPPWLAGANH
jgi:hypothetical protein